MRSLMQNSPLCMEAQTKHDASLFDIVCTNARNDEAMGLIFHQIQKQHDIKNYYENLSIIFLMM